MKKFCSKLSKPQWRVTVPNLQPPALFRQSSGKEKEKTASSSSTGSYDLEAAAKEYDRSRSVVVLQNVDSSDSETDSECYEDATMSEKLSSPECQDDSGIYAEPQPPQRLGSSKVLDEFNSRYEYDVPRINFSFFESQPQYQECTPKPKHKTELHIPVEQLREENLEQLQVEQFREEFLEEISHDRTYHSTESEEKPRLITEVKITLTTVQIDVDKGNYVKLSKSYSDLAQARRKSDSNIVTEAVKKKELVTRSLDFSKTGLIMGKSESVPNISCGCEDEQNDEGFYKVPGAARRYRISQSLDDISVENVDRIPSAHSSVEHISCSQVLATSSTNELDTRSSVTMDYCKTRSRMPMKLKKMTLLKKPHTKAADSWSNFRTKFSNMMADHSAKQRVGAYSGQEKIINIEDMYRSSKDKCKKMLRTTGKMFSKVRKNQENVDPNGSQIVRHDAFFAKMVPRRALKASDIQHTVELGVAGEGEEKVCDKADSPMAEDDKTGEKSSSLGSPITISRSGQPDGEDSKDFDSLSLRSVFRKNRINLEGQSSGFDDLRRYCKQGNDFSKELSSILQERSDAELQYAKSLSKLSLKLSRACRDGLGGLNEAWKMVASELESRAEAHRLLGTALSEDAARPLKTLAENQHKVRKQVEGVVDKSSRSLGDWRTAEGKSKKHSHTCARDNEKLQDAMLDVRLSRSSSLIHLNNQKVVSEKETAKLEGKKRKAEDAVKKSDIEYYTLCVRAERSRLEWEASILKGTNAFQTLEEERLGNLKSILTNYLHHNQQLAPRLLEATQRLHSPVSHVEPSKDLTTFSNLRATSQQTAEQLLPDFYCEHITLAMNRERRKQALVKLLHLIRQDIERERKSKNGLENLSKAMKQTPNFGAEDSQQNVSEKLYHMKSMLTYLEGARYKIQNALAELDNRPRVGHPLAAHITITRDKSGLQHSVLKVPQWLRDEWGDPERSPTSEKLYISDNALDELPDPDWTDREAGDGNSNQLDSDFDEFSSQGSSAGGGIPHTEDNAVQPIAQCRALYPYTPNLPDELPLQPGDMLSVYRKQEDGWWLGECKGSVGIFPATYVETVSTV